MPKFTKFNTGMGDSKQEGYEELTGLDIHNEVGTVSGAEAMTKDSGATVTETVKYAAANPANGDSWWVSYDSGKIWKRTHAGVWSLDHTNTNGAHRGAKFFNQDLYFCSYDKLGTYDVEGDSWNDTLGTFTNKEPTFHPMGVQSNKLWIGDRHYITSVDSANTFTANALDLTSDYVTTAIYPHGNDVTIGTKKNYYTHDAASFKWDGYSPSWWDDWTSAESVLALFVPLSGSLMCFNGVTGNVYTMGSGAAMSHELFVNGLIGTEVLDHAACTLQGRTYFAWGHKIYTISRKSPKHPYAVNAEYVCSAGSDATIHCLLNTSGTLFASWSTATTYGVDKIGTNRYSGYVITPVMKGYFSEVTVEYESMPAGCSLTIAASVDGGAYSDLTTVHDTINNTYFTTGGIAAEMGSLQIKVTLNASTTLTPTIKKIIVK